MSPNFDSFGRVDRHQRHSVSPEIALEDLFEHTCPEVSLLAFGNGKSYGDSCHNDTGVLIPMRSNRAILGFDPDTGILSAEAGATLEEIIAHAAPFGFFPAVTPGTRFVTLGGAIAKGEEAHLGTCMFEQVFQGDFRRNAMPLMPVDASETVEVRAHHTKLPAIISAAPTTTNIWLRQSVAMNTTGSSCISRR